MMPRGQDRSGRQGRQALRMVLTLALAGGSAAAAQAAPAHYQCTGYRPLEVDFTPRKAQILFEGRQTELQRVRDGGEARYTGRGGSLTVRKGALSLQLGGEALQCKLLTTALSPENLGVPAPKPPAQRPAPASPSGGASGLSAPRG